MKIIRVLIAFTLLSVLCACTHGPVKNVGFDPDIELKDLDGTYENLMESTPGRQGIFSSYIWKYAQKMENKGNFSLNARGITINYVNITVNKYKVMFEAIGGGCIVARKVVDVDPQFEDGELELMSSYSNISVVHIGPSYLKRTIGIDIAGDSKFRGLTRAGGLLFWIIPFAVFETWDYRINKLDDKLVFPECEYVDID